MENEESLKLTFDSRTEIEEGFDYVYIYSGDGTEIGKYTGKELCDTTIKVPGDTVKIKLVSDKAGTAWGFKIASIVGESAKPTQVISVEENYNKKFDDSKFNLNAFISTGNGVLSYRSANPEVVIVDVDGNVTINGTGTAQIIITASGTEEYKKTSRKITVIVSKAAQTPKISYKSDTINEGQSAQIKVENTIGKPTYESDNIQIATVDAVGKVTGIREGTAGIIIKVDGNQNYEDFKKKITIHVLKEESTVIPLSLCNLQLTDTAYIADGTEKKPSVTITYNDTTLVEGNDYTVEYANNINPGTATVTIIAAADSNYTGIAQLTFEIKPAAEEAPVVIQPNAFSNCANLVNANIKESVTEIGDEAFADCKNLLNIYFYGNCPKFGKAVFKNVTATAYYPYADNSWTLDELQNYGGNITWLPWNPETQTPEKRDLALCKINMRTSGYSYTGKAQVPEITITDGVYTLAAGKDYKVTCTDNINAGNATVTVEGTGNYGGSFRGTFVIDKAVPTLNFQNKMVEGTVADGVKYKNNLTAQETDGKITYSCDKNNIIEMFWDNNGVVISAMHAGTVAVTVKAEEGRNYLAGSTSFTVKVNKAAGKITASDITRNYSAKKQYVNTGWQSNGGRKLTYSSDNKAVKIDAKGKITIAKKFTGLATITVKASETNDYKAGSCKVAVTVKPSKTSITRVVNGAKKKATVTWKKNKTGTGYVIQYSTDKRFRKGVKTLYISKNKTTKATLSKLSKGKKYYVRIATYKVAGKNKICSSWSKVKRIKIRK